jgi:hypothetical protein
VHLYVAEVWPVKGRPDEDDSDLNGVIFLLDRSQTPESELSEQTALQTVPQPEPPPHNSAEIRFKLRTPSNVTVDVYPEREESAVFHWMERDLPANVTTNVTWNFQTSMRQPIRNGWYTSRIRATSTRIGAFQPDLAILFLVRTGPRT